MAAVTGITKERAEAIEAASVVAGSVSGNDLILTRHDGTTMNAGNVRGPQGPAGVDAAPGDVNPTAGTTPIRGTGGVVKGGTPTVSADLTTKAYVDAADTALSGSIATTNGNVSALQTQVSGAEIGNAVNLNVYTTTGLWFQSSDAEAATGTNYPEPKAGLLEVSAIAGGALIIQRYTPTNGLGKYHYERNFFGTWGAWKIYDSRDNDDTGWQVLTLITANFVLYGAEPVYYRRKGDTVSINGAIKPATSTIATGINGSGGGPTNFADLNAIGIKPSRAYSLYQVCHGSALDKWLLAPNGNFIAVSRYSGTATTTTWLPFSVSYLL